MTANERSAAISPDARLEFSFTRRYPAVIVFGRGRERRAELIAARVRQMLETTSIASSLHVGSAWSTRLKHDLVSCYPRRVGVRRLDETADEAGRWLGEHAGAQLPDVLQVFDGAETLIEDARFARVACVGGPVIIGLDEPVGVSLPHLLERTYMVVHEPKLDYQSLLLHSAGASEAFDWSASRAKQKSGVSKIGFRSVARQSSTSSTVAPISMQH